ncbi:alpha/beta-hydrolase [Rhizopus microsporus ATCC 52813]|uniref:triacylglycerol lipase n=2 Tax=Rhizopus microsporus TaxID=58291 RepID=A0A2G4SJ55_RHIZD|nr:alpha/beta-hydrolase [Rhizopus microsporus ATCC 52813]PHZ08789.1 alpha/beta-hydrolase [Rhizopus microsporus ATCC 52813]
MSTQDYEYPLRSTLQVVDKPAVADIVEFSASNHRWRNRFRPIYLESSIDSVPDVTHRPTVLALAQMTNNAYLDINLNETDWYDLGPTWRVNNSFGWESDGIRGHIFGNEDNSLIVISIKGTSAGLWTGGPTGERDKLNDNALFSCCCARISRAWTPVCDCYKNNEYVCENSCLQKKISDSELYYDNALALYSEVANTYPNSTIWITGHSLGGALSSLVGQTYGVPTVTFEAPGDRLASSRLHLPQGRGVKLPIWHFGHTADPIFVGVCTGPSSSCWYGGYAMESRCHTSKVCVWDTVKDNGWRVDIRSHRIKDMIEAILLKPDEFPMPECVEEQDCEDCGLWQYYDERDGPFPTTTTTTSTASRVTSTSTTATSSEPLGDPWKTFNDINTD